MKITSTWLTIHYRPQIYIQYNICNNAHEMCIAFIVPFYDLSDDLPYNCIFLSFEAGNGFISNPDIGRI